VAWDEYGVWGGRIEKENGEWLIGDQMPQDHPGYVATDDPRGLMVKYWTANQNDRSKKYLGRGHEVPLPAHGGRFEGVQVLFGWSWCQCGGVIFRLGRGPRQETGEDHIDLDPNVERRWFLGDSPCAWGVTICRHAKADPEEFGAGTGYEYLVLDTAQTKPGEWPERLRAPVHLTDWSYRLIMVFRGFMCRRVERRITHHLLAFAKNYAYTQREEKGDWRPPSQPRARAIAAVVYY